MMLPRRSIRQVGLLFVTGLVQAALLIGPNARSTSAQVVNESFFAMVDQPIGVAATPGKLYVTRPFCGNPRQVLSIDSTGSSSVFATLPDREGGCFEEYITVVPAPPNSHTLPRFPTQNPAGFNSNFIYVTQGPNVKQISPFDGSVAQFASLPTCPSTSNGITVDSVGTFGFQLIVACSNGQIWLLNSSGQTVTVGGTPTSSPIATVPAFIEGPTIVASTFAPFGGQLLVASETTNTVYAVSNLGAVSTVASVNTAEIVDFIPSTLCDFAASGGAWFSAIFSTSIFKLPASVFTGLDDGKHAVVPSEVGNATTAGLTLLTSSGTPPTISSSTFRSFFAQHEGSAFVNCNVPRLLKIIVKPDSIPHAINTESQGTIKIAILGELGFDPTKQLVLTPAALRAGPPATSNNQSFTGFCSFEAVTSSGFIDAECEFDVQAMFAGSGITGVYTGPIIVKGVLKTGSGDPDAEGGG